MPWRSWAGSWTSWRRLREDERNVRVSVGTRFKRDIPGGVCASGSRYYRERYEGKAGLLIEEAGDGWLVRGLSAFNLKHTLECGQAFRWERAEDGTYVGVVSGHAVRLREAGGKDSLWIGYPCASPASDAPGPLRTSASSAPGSPAQPEGAPERAFLEMVVDYLRLRDDHAALEGDLSRMDPILAEAVRAVGGIRILKQDPWECLISYIISARNSIPAISRTVERISARWGELVWDGPTGRRYSFPKPEALARAGVEEIETCGASFRSGYIAAAARLVASGDLDLESLRSFGYLEAREALMGLRGVGPKIADCVCLFSLGHFESFPVDVWIYRAMKHLYFGGEDVGMPAMWEFARDRFGPLAGCAQEYIFYYARGRLARALREKEGVKAIPEPGERW